VATTNKKVKQAMELDQKIRGFRTHQKANWLEMGSAVCAMQRSKGFQLLGYKTFESYQASFGESRSLIFEAKSLVEAFESMPKEKRGYLIAVPKENLKLLAKLPERQRYADTYLEAAKKLKTRDLRSKIDDKGYHVTKTTFYKFGGVPFDALPLIEKQHERLRKVCKGDIHPLEVIAVILESVSTDVLKKIAEGE
jgi:hypothetical protein